MSGTITTLISTCTAGVLLLTTFSSCNDKSAASCDWNKFEFRAKVDSIVPLSANAGLYSVYLSFDVSSLSREPQRLEALKDFRIDAEFLKTNRIDTSNIYTGEVHEVIDGNCTSPVISFDQRFR